MIYGLLSEEDVVLDDGSGFNFPVPRFVAKTMCMRIGLEAAPSRHIAAVKCEVEINDKCIEMKMTDDVV